MLLVYAWMQPIAASTGPTALALAVFLSASVVLAVSRRLIGAIGLALGGIALLAQTATTVILSYAASPDNGWIALYYAAFWTPAGLVALVCGGRIAGPALRLISDR